MYRRYIELVRYLYPVRLTESMKAADANQSVCRIGESCNRRSMGILM